MRWVVTGGLGFVGTELVRSLLMNDYQVLILDNGSKVSPRAKTAIEHPNCTVHRCDIRDLDSFQNEAIQFGANYFAHLAAIHYIPECNSHPDRALAVNVVGTQNILRVFEASTAERFGFVSSGAIYADKAQKIYESDLISPVDVYGVSKYTGELLCGCSSKREMISIIRLFNVYGPGETNNHIIPEILSQLASSSTLGLGNIDTIRDFVHVNDAAKGIIAAICEIGSLEAVNLSGQNSLTMRHLIEKFQDFLGRPLAIHKDLNKYRPADKDVQIADIRKIKELTSWKPRVDFDAGVAELLSEYLLE